MKEKFIKSYASHLTKDDINKFAKENNVILSSYELDFIYDTIQNHFDTILNDPNKILRIAKEKLQPGAYNKLYELYVIYYPKLYH